MPLHAPGATDRNPGPAPDDAPEPSADRQKAVRLGIGFDGRYYRYRDYRYDRLSDAIAYAEIDGARSGGRPADGPPQWLEPHRPTDEERALMARYAVTFDGRFYLYRGYRYDRCIDAVNYAKSQSPG